MKRLKKLLLCVATASMIIMPSAANAVTLEAEESQTVCCGPAMTTVPSQTVYKPVVLTQITSSSKSAQVYVYANTTLYVKSGNRQICKKTFQSEGIKTVRFPAQKEGQKLKFYLKNEANGKIEKAVLIKVRSAAAGEAPARPKVTQEGNKLLVKGNIGCRIYVKQNGVAGKENWYRAGAVLSKNGSYVDVETPAADSEETRICYVKLRAKNGKYSKGVRVKVAGTDTTVQ